MAEAKLDETQVIAGELDYLKNTHGQADPDRLAGLAVSGGGIRSASFALGVIQALCRFGIIEKLHYLSTVSGGGYIGSCLTWLGHRFSMDGDNDSPCAWLGRKGVGARRGKGKAEARGNHPACRHTRSGPVWA